MTYFCDADGFLLKLCFLYVNIDTKRGRLSSSLLLAFSFWGGWREQLSRAEEKMNGLDGCYCERTCSVKGVVYREEEGWTDGCRNCTCSVGLHTFECVSVCVCVLMRVYTAHMGVYVRVIKS